MKKTAEWVPLRWRSGPVEVAQLKNPAEADRQTLLDCHKPEAISFLENTPANCLVVTWAAGTSQDAEQQTTFKPLLERAKQLGIAVVGAITGDHAKAAQSAQASGLAGILTNNPAGAPAGLDVIPSGAAATLARSPAGAVAASDAVWPQIPIRRGGGGAGGGPTGTPWVDSNGWRVQVAQAKAPENIVWLLGEPPADLAVRAGSYSVAVADAAAYGARWVVSFDLATRRGLIAGDTSAKQTWKTVSDALGFFEKRRDWTDQTPVARAGVISDFTGANRAMAQEAVNLAARRPLPVRVIDRAKLAADSLRGLGAVLWADAQSPDAAAQKLLSAFLASGGLLMAHKSAAAIATGMKPAGSHEDRWNLFEAAKGGRVAIATKPWSDPFLLAADLHLLFSRKHDVIRAWNGGSSNFYYTAARDGKSGVVHIVNYTGRPSGDDMSLYVDKSYKTAVLHRLTGETEPLKVTPKSEGVEVYLPPFEAYAAVEYGV